MAMGAMAATAACATVDRAHMHACMAAMAMATPMGCYGSIAYMTKDIDLQGLTCTKQHANTSQEHATDGTTDTNKHNASKHKALLVDRPVTAALASVSCRLTTSVSRKSLQVNVLDCDVVQ